MSTKALSYMNSVILYLIRNYKISEAEATKAVKESYLYDSLIQYPAETMHDSISSSADDVYTEMFLNS